MGKITTDKLPDMQKTQEGFYRKRIEKVGVSGIEVYLPIKMKDGTVQTVKADIKSTCSLDESTKGINMSRISRTINKILNENSVGSGFENLELFVKELREAHQSPDIYIEADFKLLLNDKSPMSDLYSPEPVNVQIKSQYRDGKYKTFLTVKSTEMSLCPCSKTMSLLVNNITKEEEEELRSLSPTLFQKVERAGFGAHNQKSIIQATVELNRNSKNPLWIEDIRDMIRLSSSCPSYSVLKRNDEKYVTEVSYMGGYIDDDKNFIDLQAGYGPKFVEDIIRNLAAHLDKELDGTINDYILTCNNQESIHSENIMATAILTAGRDLQ